MPQIITLSLGDYQTNCYIVSAKESKTCAVIDPGYNAAMILDCLQALELTPDAILLTHGHFDHLGALEALRAETGCALWMQGSAYRNWGFLFESDAHCRLRRACRSLRSRKSC